MATRNFTQFDTATPLTTSDYIVGYNAAGTAEIKTQVQSILNLKSDSDSQTLSFNEGNKNLTISSGNTVSLSGLSDTAFQSASSSFATNTTVANITATLLPTTIYQNASSVWQDTFTTVQSNSAFWAIDSTIDTEVRALTGNWQSTYTTYQSNSSFYVSSNSTLETPTTGISAVSNIVFLNQATYNNLTVKLPTTMYVIVSA